MITIKTQAPSADFVATVTTPRLNETIAFVDRSYKGTAPITAWQWNFGDGTTSTEQNPTHAYTKLGAYTVALNVTTAHGANTQTKASYIELQVNPPAADFTGSPLDPDTKTFVQFADDSTPGDAPIVAWEWNFGYSPRYIFFKSSRTPGGVVEAHLDAVDGRITAVRLLGDYFGRRSVTGLEEHLVGCPHDRAALAARLADVILGDYLFGVDLPTFLDCLF